MRRTFLFVGPFLLSFWVSSAALAMGDNVIGQVLDQVQQRLTNIWDWLWDPLWKWYFVGFLIFMACVVIAYFLPFKWIRAFLGLVIALTAAFIAGGRQMRMTYKDRLEEERRRRLEAERQVQQDRGSGDGAANNWFPWKW